MALTLKLLGGFSVCDETGAILSLPTRKTRALLAYLAVNADRPQPRERLMALLWSDRGERQARQSLNQAVLSIRKLANSDDAPLLDSNSEQVTLFGAAVSCDVQRLRTLIRENPSAAASLYEGPFLDGLSVPDPEFEYWLLATRSELHALACDALERAVESSDDLSTAIDLAKRLVLLEPLREDAHRRLIQLLHQSGDRAGALCQYRTCAEILERDLQVEPEAATRQIYEEIRREAGEAAPHERPSSFGKEPIAAPVVSDEDRDGAMVAETSPRQRRQFVGAAVIVASIAIATAAVWFLPWGGEREQVSTETRSLPMPARPSIAVLPFKNISGDPSQEYFADGMTEDLITDLSKISGLFIIARKSAFTYKGTTADHRQIASELGVRYVLGGSVRRVGNHIRINAQLVDAATGGHLWADRYDGTTNDVLALQDRINRQITKALALKLTPSEALSVTDRGTSVVEAHDAFLKGWKKYLQLTPDALVEAASDFEKAIALDPDYRRAHAAAALTYWEASQRFWEIHFGTSWTWMRTRMLSHLDLALKEPSAIAFELASSVYVAQRRYDEAIAAARQAIELAPNNAEAYRALAYSLVMDGQPIEAREVAEKAWRLDPRAAGEHFFLRGIIAFSDGKLVQAADLMERARTHQEHAQSILPPLIAAYMHLGRSDKGKALFKIYYDHYSTHTADLRNIMYFWPLKNSAVAAKLADGLLLAGVDGKRSDYYRFSQGSRLTGAELAKLFRYSKSIWKVHDFRNFGSHPMDLTDSFQDDGTIIRRFVDYFGHPTFEYRKEWIGRFRIDRNLLCFDIERVEVGGTGCGPLFHKATATPSGDRSFVFVGIRGFYEISPAQ